MKTGKDLINFIMENKLEDVVIDSEWQDEDRIWMSVSLEKDTSIDYMYNPWTGETLIKYFKIIDHDAFCNDLDDEKCFEKRLLTKEEALELRGL